MSDDVLLTKAQAAARVGKSPRTIERWVAAGRLPVAARLEDDAPRFAPADVDAAADAAVPATPDTTATALVSLLVDRLAAEHAATLAAKDETIAQLAAERDRLLAEVARLRVTASPAATTPTSVHRRWWRRLLGSG